MVHRKSWPLFIVALVAVTALVGAGSASATVLCKSAPANHVCPAADKYGVNSELAFSTSPGTETVFEMGVAAVKCKKQTLNSLLSGSGGDGISVAAQISQFSMTECNFPIETTKLGWLTIDWTSGSHDGIVNIEGLEFVLTISKNITCYYGGSVKSVKLIGGSAGQLSFNVKTFKQAGSNAACANEASWRATLNGKGPLYVEQK